MYPAVKYRPEQQRLEFNPVSFSTYVSTSHNLLLTEQFTSLYSHHKEVYKMKAYKSFIFPNFQMQTLKHLCLFGFTCSFKAELFIRLILCLCLCVYIHIYSNIVFVLWTNLHPFSCFFKDKKARKWTKSQMGTEKKKLTI